MALLSVKVADAAPSGKPNIVMVLTDDEEVELLNHMASVKALIAAQGATLAHAYYNDPMCCPSRSTMLTGKYAQNTGVLANSHGQFMEHGNAGRTVAVWLQAAGYRTGYVGKYLNGYPAPEPETYIPPGWDYWAAQVSTGPLQYDYRLNENGRIVGYGHEPADYADDVFAAKGLAFMRQAMADKAPFFLFLAVHAPHVPSIPAVRHQALFPDLKAPRSPSFDEEDVSDKPAFIRGTHAIVSDAVALLEVRFTAMVRALGIVRPTARLINRLNPLSTSIIGGGNEKYRNRVRQLQAVDEAVKAIVEALQAGGQLDNTYIVFASDNGWVNGEHRLRGKGLPYEEVIQIPLLIRGPGIRPGSVVEDLVGNVDLAPTFAAWGGAAVPEDVDGRSLAALLQDGGRRPARWRQVYPLIYKISHDEESEKWPNWIGLRTPDYTYAEYVTGDRELYDNRADPYQLQNLVGTADPAFLARLSAVTRQLAVCKAGSCRALEDRPVEVLPAPTAQAFLGIEPARVE